MSTLETYLLLSLFFVFLLVFFRWLKRYLRRNEIQEAFPYVQPFEYEDSLSGKKVLRKQDFVRMELPYKSHVRVEVLMDSKTVVLEVFAEDLKEGEHEILLDCSSLDSGSYILRITFDNQVTTRSFDLA